MIACRSQGEIARMRAVNGLVARVLVELRNAVKPGVTTAELDELAESRIREAGAVPAFKGYHGYPATICASVNEQVVHGMSQNVDGRRLALAGDDQAAAAGRLKVLDERVQPGLAGFGSRAGVHARDAEPGGHGAGKQTDVRRSQQQPVVGLRSRVGR